VFEVTTFVANIHSCERTREPDSIFTVTKWSPFEGRHERFTFEAANAKEAVAFVRKAQQVFGQESIAAVFPAKGFRSPPGLKKLAADLYYNPLLNFADQSVCKACGAEFEPYVLKRNGRVQPACDACCLKSAERLGLGLAYAVGAVLGKAEGDIVKRDSY